MKIIAVIPCYNAEEAIGNVVRRAKRLVDSVVVVDNNSGDETGSRACEAGASVMQYLEKQGAGASTGLGVSVVLASEHPDIVVTLDGDGQHDPDELPRVIKPIVDGEADLVIGSRFLYRYRLPRYRKLGIDVITWLYNAGAKQKITDGQSCFRAYSRAALGAILPIKEDGFSFSIETLVKARARGLRIVEVPVSCIYHSDPRKNSTINPIRHGLSVALGAIRWRIWEARQSRRLRVERSRSSS